MGEVENSGAGDDIFQQPKEAGSKIESTKGAGALSSYLVSLLRCTFLRAKHPLARHEADRS